MASEDEDGTNDSAPDGGVGQGCKDPADALVALQCSRAQDVVVTERRKTALEDMTARVTAVSGIQVRYEDALLAQRPALKQLLRDLKAIKKTVECQVTDRRENLTRCFCEKIEEESAGPPSKEGADDPYAKAEEPDAGGLEELRTEQADIITAISEHKKALDELTGLPAGMKAKVDELIAKVKELNKRICDKTIDDERAFVTQLHYRHAYVQLRRLLTDSNTYVCRIYDLLDELFALYARDVSVAGDIARLEKAKQLEDERKQGKDAEGAFIDDVLRCAKPKEPPKPPDDDTDEVNELDPCPGAGQGGTGYGAPPAEPPSYASGTGQAPPASTYPPAGEKEPPHSGPTKTQY